MVNNILLFDKDTINFNSMGLGVLTDVISCVVCEELNGEFELEMEYPIDGALYKELKEERIIYCKPNMYDSEQAFRIYEIERPIEGNININARHIRYDMNNISVGTTTASINTINYALSLINNTIITGQNSHFTFGVAAGQTFEEKSFESLSSPHSLTELIFADNDESVIDIFDAELKFDNFTCTFYKKRGTNRGVKIEYAKNMLSLTHNINSEDAYTGIMPYYDQESSQTSSSSTKQLTTAYITPGITPYKHGWLSLIKNKADRHNNRIAGSNESNIYIIGKDETDDSSIDQYVGLIVGQTGKVVEGVFWRELSFDEAVEEIANPPAGTTRNWQGNLMNCTVSSANNPYTQNWLYAWDKDEGHATPAENELIGFNTNVFPEIEGNHAIDYGWYILASKTYDDNAKYYVDKVYTPVIKVTSGSIDNGYEFIDDQWQQVAIAIYAVENPSEQYTLEKNSLDNFSWSSTSSSSERIQPGDSKLNENSTYLVVNQRFTDEETGQTVVAQAFSYSYYYRTTIWSGNVFATDQNFLSKLLNKFRSLTKSTTTQVHKVYMLCDDNDIRKPRYFDNHSASEVYQKIKMVDVSSEFSTAPTSDADFTEKIESWLDEHIKDYDHNKVEVETSFVLLSDDPEYASLFNNERVELGDTVTISYTKFDIQEEQRVVSLTYDVLTNKVTEIALEKEEDEN